LGRGKLGTNERKEGRMKTLWSNFIVGAFLAVLVAIAFNAMPEKVNAAEGVKQPEEAMAHEETDLTKLEAVAKALQEKEQNLAAMEVRLQEWEQRLALQEESVKERVAEFKTLTAKNDVYQKEQEKRRKIVEERLKKTFETMKPQKAAEVLTVMDDALAVELLLALKAKNVASIFDKMDSNKAMMLSTKLAKQRKPASK